MKNNERARIFDIQGFSVHDGPGGRTLIFFKGCPLRCVWCCNPEGVNPYREVMYKSLQCQKCYNCVGKCSQKAISINGSTGLILFDRSICKECDTFECVEACYNGALGITGKDYSIDELMHKIERDRRFWGKGGGVTLGGGEVLQQYKFASRLLERCHANYIHTAIETSAYAPWSHLQGVLKNTDWVFVDIKCMDSDIHSKVTGVPNRLILENIKRMAAKNRNYRLIPRIPIIPGINDDNKNIFETVEFLKRVNLFEINILPFHRLGTSKYEQLGLEYAFAEMESPETDVMERIRDLFEAYDIRCYVGSDTPF